MHLVQLGAQALQVLLSKKVPTGHTQTLITWSRAKGALQLWQYSVVFVQARHL
jgi:hypothetical protein